MSGGMESFMKKLVLCTTLLMLLLVMSGCTKDDVTLTPEEVTQNTIVARANGQLQVATIEDFDKSNYNINELKEYMDKIINDVKKTAGEEKIKIDSIEKIDKKAISIMTYSSMEPYAALYDVTAAFFTGGVKDIPIKLPETLISVKDKSLASTADILKNDKYKILVLKEPYKFPADYQVIVEGKIKYYSENSELIDSNTVKGAYEGTTVIVFR